MKKTTSIVLACAAVLLAPSLVFPQMLPIPPGRWWERPRVIDELALTEEQQGKIEDLTIDQARNLVDLKAGVEKAEIELRVVADAEPFDAARVRTAFSFLQQARMRMETERFETLIRVRQTLTEPQWTRLKELTREWVERADKEGEMRDRVGPRPKRARP